MAIWKYLNEPKKQSNWQPHGSKIGKIEISCDSQVYIEQIN
jgi:hypothetical protein